MAAATAPARGRTDRSRGYDSDSALLVPPVYDSYTERSVECQTEALTVTVALTIGDPAHTAAARALDRCAGPVTWRNIAMRAPEPMVQETNPRILVAFAMDLEEKGLGGTELVVRGVRIPAVVIVSPPEGLSVLEFAQALLDVLHSQ